MVPAPIVLFVYNRPNHTRLTVESLARNGLAGESELYVFSDGPKNDKALEDVRQVREYVRDITGFRRVSIVEREANWGLARSVIAGVTEVIERYGRAIVMEDDLLSTPNFLAYMNRALELYRDNPDIFSITGLNFPIAIPEGYKEQAYLSYRSSSWGWGTWADRWSKVDWEVSDFATFVNDREARKRFNRGGDDLADMLVRYMDGKNDSWAIRWCYAHFRHNAYCLFATKSKIRNIGLDSSGTHCPATDRFTAPLDDCREEIRLPEDPKPNREILQSFAAFHRPSLRDRIKSALKL